jgi:6-phosphogluconolactonase (cycloisomerase 2 family)
VTLLASSALGAQKKPLGALTQLSGKAGCFTPDGSSEDGANTCTAARGVIETESAIVSPDGRNVYVGSYGSQTLSEGFAVFSRNGSTGALKQLKGKAGCLTPDGSSIAGAGTCTVARGVFDSMGDGHDLVFASNGRWAYIASNAFGSSPGGILIFKRSLKTGALKQLSGKAGCITTDGSDQNGPGACQVDSHLLQASGLTLSSDERFLYVTGTGDSEQIEIMSRNTKTGGLKQLQCIAEAPTPSGCSTGRVVGDTQFIALTPNGKHAYAGQYSYGMSVFDRNPKTGLLTQKPGTAGCITDNGKDDTGASTCATARLAASTFPLLIAPNGKTLYNGDSSRGFSTFHINSNGTLSQLAGTNGCMTIDGKDNTGATTCAIGRAVPGPYGGAISPDGKTLYIANDNGSTIGGVAVFRLKPTTGVATQLAGNAGCITGDGSAGGATGTCTNGRALGYGYGMSVSPDGKSVYEATDYSGAGLAVFRRQAAPPVLSSLHVAGHPGKLRISFKLSVPDLVKITFSRGGHALSGELVESGKAGANLFGFNGKVGGHLLGRGTYQATATPVGGRPKKTSFTLAP